jgi:antitoxin VapB
MILEEIKIKDARIKQLLEEKKLAGILLSKLSSFLWFPDGKRNQVIKNEDISLVYLLITKSTKYLIATKSDCYRIMDEELENLGFELILLDWYEQSVIDSFKKIGIKGAVGCDFYYGDYPYIEEELAHLRINLTESEVKKVSVLCQEYSELLTDFCFNLKPGITELDVEADLSYICLKNNIIPFVTMVGSDERIFKYRHPVATNKKIERYILIATAVERGGINVSLSRSVYWGNVPDEIRSKQEAVNFIEATYYYHSRPGVRLRELFEEGKKVYSEVAYPDEWRNHTQGGIVGYKPREFLVTPDSEVVLRRNNLMGWNPTLPGVKAEDFILVEENGIKQLSIDKRWPYEEIDIKGRNFLKPKILEMG